MNRRQVLAVLATVALAITSTATSADAGHQTAEVASYTACVVGSNLTSVALGDHPSKPCPPPAMEVHLSGGDITGVVAGAGLEGGGDDGTASVSLAPSFRLPQTCASGEVAKWDGSSWGCATDDAASYDVGEGLDLDGSTLSIDPYHRLPQTCDLGQSPQLLSLIPGSIPGTWACGQFVEADQDCPDGEVVEAVDDEGSLVCTGGAGPSGGATAYTATEHNPNDGSDEIGLLQDEGEFEVVRMVLPTGVFLLSATGTISNHQAGSPYDSLSATCRIEIGGTTVQELTVFDGNDDGDIIAQTMALSGTTPTDSGGVARVLCRSFRNGTSARAFQFTALQVAGVVPAG